MRIPALATTLALALTLPFALVGCHPVAASHAAPSFSEKPVFSHADRAAQSSPPAAADASVAEPVVACARDEDCFHSGHGHRARCFTQAMADEYTQAFHDCVDGAAWRAAHQVGTCVFDACRGDDGPDGDTCGPTARCGILDMVPFPQRVCVPATCHRANDCTVHRGGSCASYLASGPYGHGGWACSYPGDECAPRHPVRRCPVERGVINYCAPVDGRFHCVPHPAVCAPVDAGT